MRQKCLIVVDMQNDFIDGSLTNETAKKIIPSIKNEIKYGNYDHIIFTRDTHTENYLNTPEGKHLPIVHCVKGTEGWELNMDLFEEACMVSDDISFFDKPTFGSIGLLSHIQSCGDFDEVVFCGTCTDICVISNVLILKTLKPDLKISVIADCCAGLTPEKHESALSVMESCQINIIKK